MLEAYIAAERDIFSDESFPYVFIDSSNKGFLSSYRVFTNISRRYRVGYSNTGMRGFVVPEQDFKLLYKIIKENKKSVRAIKNENALESRIRDVTEESKDQKREKKSRKRKQVAKKYRKADSEW